MKEKNRKPIASYIKLPQFTTMNVIDGQAGLIIYASLIFYSLTIDNILNIIVLLILAGVTIATLTGDNGLIKKASTAKETNIKVIEKEKIQVEVAGAYDETGRLVASKIVDNINNNISDATAEATSNGFPVKVTYNNGHKYQVESDGKITEGEDGGNTTKAAGLYNNETKKLWQVLLDEGIISVENGIIKTLKTESLVGELVLDDSVTSIGKRAFMRCSGLTNITIPSSVTSIGEEAFSDCTSLTSIIIPSGVTSISQNAFSDCTSLTSITIPSSVTSIEKRAFLRCRRLTNITIPSSVTSIGEEAFRYCSGLTSITISSSVTSIGRRAFMRCSGLTNITIPSSVTSIGEEAFGDCTSLTSITVEKVENSIADSPWGATGATITWTGK